MAKDNAARQKWSLFEAEAVYADSIFRSAIGDSAGCIQALERAIEIKPTYAPAVLSMGSVEYQRNRKAKGRNLLLSLVAMPDDTVDIVAIIDKAGDFLIGVREYADGLELYRAAARRFPEVAVMHQGRGCCAGHMGELEEAVAASRRALELEPDNQKFVKNAWRFVTDDALRERLKEAKGIGTPATRAEIIKGLKRQNLLAADGKLVVPTPAGLQLFGLLKGAVPALVDPGMTAVWEMRLDQVVTGRVHFKGVIDEIAAEAGKLIGVLRGHTGPLVDLSRPALTVTRRGRARARTRSNADKAPTDTSGSTRLKAKSRRARKTKAATASRGAPTTTAARSAPPTDRMVAFAEKLAKEKRVDLPTGYAKNFEICRRFLDDHTGRRGAPK